MHPEIATRPPQALTVSGRRSREVRVHVHEDKVSALFSITPEQLTHVKTVVANGSTTVKKVKSASGMMLPYLRGNSTADSQHVHAYELPSERLQ